MKHKVLSFLLAAVMSVNLFSMPVSAEEISGTEDENIYLLSPEEEETDDPVYLPASRAGNTAIYTYNAGKNTLEDVLGCSRDSVLELLESHINDNYYLGTPYGIGDYRNPNGDKYHRYGTKDSYGTAAMNCTGFVWHVLTKAGGKNVPAMSGWVTLLENKKVEYRTYVNTSNFDDLVNTILADDYISPGDIIWMWDSVAPITSTGLPHGTAPWHHVGIYIGDYFDSVHTAKINWLSVTNSQNRWWHSTNYGAAAKGFSGNQSTEISPITSCQAVTVVKLSDYPAEAGIYRDTKGSEWYYEDLVKVSEAGLIAGYPNGRFGPNDSLTRGQFATILYRAAGNPAGDYENVFSDVKSGVYYETAVSWGHANDIIAGIGNDKFAPDDSITREQLVTLMYRYAQYQGNDVTPTGDYTAFADGDQVSGYAQEAMNWAIGNGIIKGDGKGLKPLNNITRAECAAIISRYLGL